MESDINIGLVAYCTVCNKVVGGFPDKGAIMRRISSNDDCPNCDAKFSFHPDGDFYNLRYRIVPSKEEYLTELLEEIHGQTQQYIFGYEDRGPGRPGVRYPQKRIRFFKHYRTSRASPAFALMIHNKDTNQLEKSYCFASPYALFQIAREALKGYYWLRYDLNVE